MVIKSKITPVPTVFLWRHHLSDNSHLLNMYISVASEAHKKWGGHSQYGNKKWGGSATSLAIELTLFLANSGAAMAASAAAAPTPYLINLLINILTII